VRSARLVTHNPAPGAGPRIGDVVVSRNGIDEVRFPLVERVRLGRWDDPANDVVLPSGRVSNQHVVIAVARRGGASARPVVVAIDLKSSYGTFINGVRIRHPVALGDSDLVRVRDSVPLFGFLRPFRPSPHDWVIRVERAA
jgi:pSer/pThr/pTyr-binding forkhead associated (FHA) protein